MEIFAVSVDLLQDDALFGNLLPLYSVKVVLVWLVGDSGVEKGVGDERGVVVERGVGVKRGARRRETVVGEQMVGVGVGL